VLTVAAKEAWQWLLSVVERSAPDGGPDRNQLTNRLPSVN